MDTNKMIRELNNLSDKHKNDRVDTFAINWSILCKDVSIKIQDLDNELNEKKEKIKEKINELEKSSNNQELKKEDVLIFLKDLLNQ